MSSHGEWVVINSLTDPVAVEILATNQFSETLLPTEAIRPVYRWAIEYFRNSGRTAAPTPKVMELEFRAVLEDAGYWPLETPEESIEWAMANLRDTQGRNAAQEWTRGFAEQIGSAGPSEIPDIYANGVQTLMGISMALEDQSSAVEANQRLLDRLDEYDRRAEATVTSVGATLGISEVDEYTHRIHPGELAILAAGPKVGKSFFLAHAALKAWEDGMVPALFTLENSIDMTLDRMAVLLAGVSARGFARGRLDPELVEPMKKRILEVIHSTDHPLFVMQPDIGKRSFEQMVQSALIRGANYILIDQLTFVELNAGRNVPKHYAIGNSLHDLKTMISNGRERVPCLLAHQINREGVKQAEKDGMVQMYHLAESAEVERTADWVFGLYQSTPLKQTNAALLQTLASRREELQDFTLRWNVGEGAIGFRAYGRPQMAGLPT